MRAYLALWGLLALLTGCFSLERDTVAFHAWSKRGQVAGEMLRLYCEQGAPMERGQFLHAFRQQAGPSQGTIIFCANDPVIPPAAVKPR